MQLPVTQKLASRILRFRDSPQFSLNSASDAYSEYWLHHREQIRVSAKTDPVTNAVLLNVQGDSGFYIPKDLRTRTGLQGARQVASRFRAATKVWRRQVSPAGLDSPIHIAYARAYDICQRDFERDGLLNESSLALPGTAIGVAKDFSEWSGRLPNDHVLLAYHLLRLTCGFDGLPGPSGTVLEIGAGNGNMASVIKHYFPAMRMVVVDLPETLLLSISYLSSVFPDDRFVLPNEVDSNGIDGCDFLFLTPDQVDLIPNDSVSLVINTHSFQEMTSTQIASYFLLFQRVLIAGGQSLVVNRVEKAPVASEVAVLGEHVNRFSDYPWPSSWKDLYYLNSKFHMLVQQDNVFVRLQRAMSGSTPRKG